MFEATFSTNADTLDATFSSDGDLNARFGELYVLSNIHMDTTDRWNAQMGLIAKKNHLYVYTDYTNVDGELVPGVKVGDGTSYLIDLPFVAGNVDTGGASVKSGTKEYWDSQRTLVGKAGTIYVYTDYISVSGTSIPGIKIGDGTSYLIDSPFVSGDTTRLDSHISDMVSHITAEERDFWNNKVTCFMSSGDEETIVFTKT